MTIDIELSTAGIQRAIRKLEKVRDNLDADVTHIVDTLAKEGAIRARIAYNGMAHATSEMVSDTEAKIVADGGDRETTIIAEFGAGYATMEDHPFAANAPVPIEVASYSRQNNRGHGGLFYWTDFAHPGEGFWYFGGQEYDRVEPKHGLLDAYDWILGNSTRIAREVIEL